jgi:hypothetical protein
MKAYGGKEVSSMSLLLYPQGKYSLDRRLGGPQSRSGHCGEEYCWELNTSLPAHNLSLYQLIYPGSMLKKHAIYFGNLNYDLCGTCKYKAMALVHKYNNSAKCEVNNL